MTLTSHSQLLREVVSFDAALLNLRANFGLHMPKNFFFLSMAILLVSGIAAAEDVLDSGSGWLQYLPFP